MSTTTARLGLTKPAPVGEVVDIAILNTNFDKIDTAAGFTVCTSGTRPGTPYTGQQILETDTGNRYYWSGSYWRGIGRLTCTSGARPTNQREGQEIYETDTDRLYVYDGATWKHIIEVATAASLTLGANWATQSGYLAPRITRIGDNVQITGTVFQRTGATLAVSLGNFYTVATVPAGFRPLTADGVGAGAVGVAGNLGAAQWVAGPAGNLSFAPYVASGTIATGGGVGNSIVMPTLIYPLA